MANADERTTVSSLVLQVGELSEGYIQFTSQPYRTCQDELRLGVGRFNLSWKLLQYDPFQFFYLGQERKTRSQEHTE